MSLQEYLQSVRETSVAGKTSTIRFSRQGIEKIEEADKRYEDWRHMHKYADEIRANEAVYYTPGRKDRLARELAEREAKELAEREATALPCPDANPVPTSSFRALADAAYREYPHMEEDDGFAGEVGSWPFYGMA